MLSANLQPIQPVVGKHHSCSAFIMALTAHTHTDQLSDPKKQSSISDMWLLGLSWPSVLSATLTITESLLSSCET